MALTLRTPRLALREWRDEDRVPFAAMSADREVMQYLPPVDDEWIDRQRRHFAEHGFAYWAVEVPGEAAFIGAVGLYRLRFPAPFTPAVEVGWRLARLFWGKSYAFEAARAATEDGFYRLGLDEIVAITAPANRRSWRVMERLGMRRNPKEDFDFPGFPEGHPLRRTVLYRLKRA